MDLDVQQLSAEIRKIDSEYRQANERLQEVYARGRGRGRYRGRARARFSPHQPTRALPNRYQSQYPEALHPAPATQPDQSVVMESIVEEPRVASSIVGADREENKDDFIPPVLLKRPGNRAIEEDPKMRDRNRRMFNSLLGTLEKFREENESVEKSEKWKKREEISKRAIEKSTAESFRLKEKERKDREERKLQETERLKELNSLRKTKALQLTYAKRVQQKELLLNFISTSELPVILWSPAKHNSETQALIDQKKVQHEAWLAEQKENFEKEKVKMETGEGPGDVTVSDCRPKAIEPLTTDLPKTSENEMLPNETEEMQFQPVSEMHIPMEEQEQDQETGQDLRRTGEFLSIDESLDERRPAKKAKLKASDKEEDDDDDVEEERSME